MMVKASTLCPQVVVSQTGIPGIPDHQLDISTWVSRKLLKCHVSKMELCSPSPVPTYKLTVLVNDFSIIPAGWWYQKSWSISMPSLSLSLSVSPSPYSILQQSFWCCLEIMYLKACYFSSLPLLITLI